MFFAEFVRHIVSRPQKASQDAVKFWVVLRCRQPQDILGGLVGKQEAIHEAMRPTGDEVAWARRVVAAVAASRIQSGVVVVVDGRMVDVPVIRQAERILAQAER